MCSAECQVLHPEKDSSIHFTVQINVKNVESPDLRFFPVTFPRSLNAALKNAKNYPHFTTTGLSGVCWVPGWPHFVGVCGTGTPVSASPRPLGDLEGLAELCRASGLAGEAVRKFLSDHVLSELPTVRLCSDKPINFMI